MSAGTGSARFALVFEASNLPSRAEYLDDDAALQGVGDKLRRQTFPVKLPDVPSVKVIRRAKVSCDGTGCSAVLLPMDQLGHRDALSEVTENGPCSNETAMPVNFEEFVWRFPPVGELHDPRQHSNQASQHQWAVEA